VNLDAGFEEDIGAELPGDVPNRPMQAGGLARAGSRLANELLPEQRAHRRLRAVD